MLIDLMSKNQQDVRALEADAAAMRSQVYYLRQLLREVVVTAVSGHGVVPLDVLEKAVDDALTQVKAESRVGPQQRDR